MMIIPIVTAAVVGVAAAAMGLVVAFVAAPFGFDAVGWYIEPDRLFGWILDAVTPFSVVSWVVMEGPGGGVLILLGAALVCWTAVTGSVYWYWRYSRMKRAS